MSNEDHGVSGKQYIDAVSVGLSDRIPSDDDADYICLQTGEEFSAEFLRDRVASRKFPVITDADQHLPNRLDANIRENSPQLVYEDLKHVLGLRRTESDSNSDLLEIASVRGYVDEVDSRAYPNNLNRYQCEHSGFRQASGTFSRQLSGKFSEGNGCDQVNSGPNAPSVYVVESPHSCHPYGSVFSEGSFYKKIKFLCSFGGRILPRPNDGKLRYVGGETRIISIRKNIKWEELMRKTSAICSQTHIIKDSSTSAFASEMKDCTPTSPNLVGILSKPGSQYFTALAGKSVNQMSPLSPACVQPTDPKISNVQIFKDKPYNAINESITPFVTEKVPCNNSLYVDNTNYIDPVAYHNNQYIVKSDLIRKPGKNLHLHRRNNSSNEFVSSTACSLTDLIFERPLVTNEGSYHFNKVVSRPHESSSLFSESDVREGSRYRMLHAHSDSTLKENDENYKVHLQFPLSVERDNFPSLKNSCSLEECSIQPGKTIDRKEHSAKYQNLPIFGMTDSFNVSEKGKEILQHADNSNDFFNENVGAMSQDNSIDLKHLQYIYTPHGVCSSSPDFQSSECNLSTASSISLESTRNLRGQPHGLSLDRTASEFSTRSQNSSMHHQYAMPETKDGQPLFPGSFESQTERGSILPISYMDMGSSLREVVIPVEDPAYNLHQKEQNTVIKNQCSEYINEFCVNKPVPESVAVVKGAMDYISSGIQSCLKDVSNVDEEAEVEPTSPEKEGIECDNPESESKHAESDSGNVNKPMGDRATAETEAEVYGLQTKDFWREAQILSTLHHPNVVAFYGVVPDGPGGTLATVTEYMVHGSLRNVLTKKDRVLDRRKRLLIAMDAAFGMEYLHLKNIVHFDLKCDNLLVNLGDLERPV
ncbi:hypothetical protein JHK86_056750 [Glycine max]|nr:hypothetical protein JHK86_056750 [Glycine max]